VKDKMLWALFALFSAGIAVGVAGVWIMEAMSRK
jgi:hypothetical protein